MATTLYWHDYETFGLDTKRDRPAKFAGLRTDENLNPLEDPLVIHCKPARDVLPSPDACLINGITPQMVDALGVLEPEFVARIHVELAQSSTCGVGYNSLRFDDEITRHALYRNFYDPYAREWQNGNSRWDIIDLVRMTYALRPQGIQWPMREDGRPSFRLEDVAAANDVFHESAHDALSDVRATIAIARLIRDRQRGIYDWLFQLRDRKIAKKQLNLDNHDPVLHTSSLYPLETGCTTLVMPLVREPGNQNGVLVYDLRQDPRPFMNLDEENLRDCLFISAEDLPEGTQKLPVKSVRINKCPALAPKSALKALDAERIAIDLGACNRHWKILSANEEFMCRVGKAYDDRKFSSSGDVDLALYEGFFNLEDSSLFPDIRAASPQELSHACYDFRDERLPELLFRYRARNWPETLSVEETQRWEELCYHRIHNGDEKGSITLDHYYERIALLRDECKGDADAQHILDALDEWGRYVT